MAYKKQTCEICKGTGINEWSEYGEKITIKCSRCRGTLISYGSCSSCGFYLNENGICQSGLCGKRDPDAPSSSSGTTAPPIKISKDGTIIRGSLPSAPPPAPKSAPASSSTSMPSASPALLKQYSNYKYVLGMYDWIDNLNGTWKGNRGKGYLIIPMDKTDGNPDIKNAKFIFDGFSEGMLVRNNEQVVYLPVMDNYIKNILLRVKEVFIAEMDNKNNIKEYTVKIDVINSSLPIPVPEKNRMKAQLK